ncbi:hypothetical protein [Nostoc sp.]|uniref:hypothetical protein n=1 Tax=Nostoc sp. TaxID=1180 RepID=UPI002FF81580
MTYQSNFDINAHVAQLIAEAKEEQTKYDARLAEIKAKETQARKEQQKRQHSQDLTSKTASLLIQKSIDKGSLDSEQYQKVYEITYKIDGQQKAQELFVSSVISLLSHKHFGVESAMLLP